MSGLTSGPSPLASSASSWAQVRRLQLHGIRDASGAAYRPTIVRVGPNFAPDVAALSLDALARARAAEDVGSAGAGGGAGAGGACVPPGGGAPLPALGGGRGSVLERARLGVLECCDVVCTTLSCAGCGGRALLPRRAGGARDCRRGLSSTPASAPSSGCCRYTMFAQLARGFDTVLIDEAAQARRRADAAPCAASCSQARMPPARHALPSPPHRALPPPPPLQAVEVAALIPLRAGCQRLVLVGDPLQLPATVFSSHASAAGYERSLFERLQQAGHRTHLLRTQYRMHPQISAFPAQARAPAPRRPPRRLPRPHHPKPRPRPRPLHSLS